MDTTIIQPRLTRFAREKDGNCFLWGCVTVVVVFILGSIAAFVGVRYGVSKIRENYTDDTMIELPVVELPKSELDVLIDEVDQFAEGLREGDDLEALTLTQDELNALLQNHPEADKWGGLIYFTIEEDDSLTGQLSVPLDFMPGFSGRYFNGYGEFEASIEDGEFTLIVNEARLNGEPIPEKVMEQFRGENMAGDAVNDPEARRLTRMLESVIVVDGVIIITPVNLAGDSADGDAEALGEEIAQ